jgi:hypothetical protein
MRTRIKKSSTLVYSGKVVVAKKSTTEVLISKWYELSEAIDPKERLAEAWAKYREFELKTAMQAVERGLYA